MRMLLLLNHVLTESQIKDAEKSWNVREFIYPDENIKKTWMKINPDGDEISSQLRKVVDWLDTASESGDLVLVQGEYGAAFYIVDYCFKTGRLPLYATSERKYVEQVLKDGSIERKHIFRHVIFRRYKRWEKKEY